MSTTSRRTPLDLPRGVSFRRTYCALLGEDGSVLPIEERIGRRLLRTIDPNSREGRQILRSGLVRVMLGGTRGSMRELAVTQRAKAPVAADAKAGAKADTKAGAGRAATYAPSRGSEWDQVCREARQRIETMRRSLSRDH